MTEFNFENSISIGIEKADIAERNLAEINEIFKDFSQAFKDFSNNAIHSEIGNSSELIRSKNFPLTSFMDSLNLMNAERRSYKALFLSNGKKKLEVAEIKISKDGYPVNINLSGDTSSYYDKDSLVQGLNILAASTEVGKYYKQLLQDETE